MQRYLSFTIILVLGLLSLNAETVLKVGYPNWAPWKIAVNDSISGIDAEILQQIETMTDLKFVFVRANWQRCQDLYEKGEIDLISDLFDCKNPSEPFICHPAYAKDDIYFYALSDRSFPLDFSELYAYDIGVTLGSKYFGEFDIDYNLSKVAVADQTQMAKMLLSGRIDLAISWDLPFEYELFINQNISPDLIKKTPVSKFRSDSDQDYFLCSHFAFSPKSLHLDQKEKFEAALKILVLNNQIIPIINRYYKTK